MLDTLCAQSRQHFETLIGLLGDNGINYKINHRLVRGLDYYSHTVFEWVTEQLGAQGTVCAAGRYDGLIEQLGGKATPGAGWASGIERLLALIEAGYKSVPHRTPHAYFLLCGDRARAAGLPLAEYLRDEIDGLCLQVDCSGGSVKSQFKRADKSGAEFALVLGEEEVDRQMISVKPLRDGGQQQTLSHQALCELLKKAV